MFLMIVFGGYFNGIVFMIFLLCYFSFHVIISISATFYFYPYLFVTKFGNISLTVLEKSISIKIVCTVGLPQEYKCIFLFIFYLIFIRMVWYMFNRNKYDLPIHYNHRFHVVNKHHIINDSHIYFYLQ